jgi:hypothetical protein
MRQTHSKDVHDFLKICSDRAAELGLWSPQGVTCLITPIDHGWVRRYRNHDGHLLEISQARTAG